MAKLKITLQDYSSYRFPAEAVSFRNGYSNAFPSTEEARRFLTGRFGAVQFVDRTAERQQVEKQAGGEEV